MLVPPLSFSLPTTFWDVFLQKHQDFFFAGILSFLRPSGEEEERREEKRREERRGHFHPSKCFLF